MLCRCYPVGCTLSYSVGSTVRTYATSAVPHAHERVGLHAWPTARQPSPIEIFGMKTEDLGKNQLEFNSAIKSIYGKFVKVYHPDISKNLVITDGKGRELNDAAKRARFDMVQDAYEVLKDPRRRMAFRTYATTSWDKDIKFGNGQSGTGSHFTYDQRKSFHAFRTANAHRSQYDFARDEAFWMAATWEDYYRMKYNREPPTMEEINKNKYKILAGVVLVAVLVFGIQVTLALERTDEHIRLRNLQSLQAQRDLQQSYDNYGSGNTQLQRLNRVLVSRRSQLVNGENETDLRNNDHEMLTKYAQHKVNKWDANPPELPGPATSK